MAQRKRLRTVTEKPDLFDQLPEDLVLNILCKLSSSASCPSDFINILTTCKTLKRLATNPLVLSKAGAKTFAMKAERWSDSAHQFLKQCVKAGNSEAAYTLGMIRFYCLQNRGSGASLMAKAAIKSHALALYSLAVIQFNGSGGSKTDKNLRAGVALCARASILGHVDALRELGHCLQDGYGVPQNIVEGRRLLVQANAKELALSLRSMLSWKPQQQQQQIEQQQNLHHACSVMGATITSCPLLSDFGCSLPAREEHPANQFLREWFETRPVPLDDGLRLCSYRGCGRAETRPHEFRRCSVCGTVNYCSRGCQALDWKARHKVECTPMDQWHGVLEDGGDGEIGAMVGMEEAEYVNIVE
ncbi:MYND DOMAIN-CONTAINING [Salix koriyanagi]|uniref:MYND DOMAIN-CONTAINING n=1 Tax=Salix koriyanagi TaxID=2511006 RepID=A0A9Q0WBI6_9ROSI|nr:MYND DOMAIN-CONTAINING [Salix koriyanagi]